MTYSDGFIGRLYHELLMNFRNIYIYIYIYIYNHNKVSRAVRQGTAGFICNYALLKTEYSVSHA